LKKGDVLVSSTGRRQVEIGTGQIGADVCGGGDFAGESGSEIERRAGSDGCDESEVRYRKAKLDASKQEILSVIEGEQAKLKLAMRTEAKEAEAKFEGGRASAGSDMVRKQKIRSSRVSSAMDEKSLALLTFACAAGRRMALQNHWDTADRANAFHSRETGRGRVRDC